MWKLFRKNKETELEVAKMSELIISLEKSQVSLNEKFAVQIHGNAEIIDKAFNNMNVILAKADAF